MFSLILWQYPTPSKKKKEKKERRSERKITLRKSFLQTLSLLKKTNEINNTNNYIQAAMGEVDRDLDGRLSSVRQA